MPIQTNCAVETALFHVPIPATKTEVPHLNALWKRQPPKNGCIVATHTKRGMILEVTKPVVMVAVAHEYWREIGRLVKRTGEPWWDLCAIVSDSEPQRRKPHAHALSLYRITAKGEMHYLHSDTPAALWPEQYPPQSKRRSRTRAIAKLLKKWQFAPDLLGVFNGPRDLSTRKGLS